MQNVLTQISNRFGGSNVFCKDIDCDLDENMSIKEINVALNRAYQAECVAKKRDPKLQDQNEEWENEGGSTVA